MRRFALLTAALTAGVLGAGAASAPAQVFINEFHYDNVDTDQDEGVEVAGPAGTDLSAYRIELTSGYGGARYDVLPLSGVLPDQQNGYGTRFFTAPGLQNGAPDGLSLIGPSGAVEHIVGYEGTFTATTGGAAGRAFEDIGRFEPPSTPVGQSLQLQGTGTTAASFVWRGPLARTPGAVNADQRFPARAAGSPGPSGTTTPVTAPGSGGPSAGPPGARRCGSRRRFRIRVAVPKTPPIVSANVLLEGKRVASTRRRRSVAAIIDLRGRPEGRYTVKIRLRTASGRVITETRRYRACSTR